MEFQKIIWSLNRSYLKTPITYDEVGQFNAALDRFSSAVNELKAQCADKGQSAEESYKMLVSQFLRDTFYKKGYSVNPIDKCDLAIIEGGRAKVLFEVKDPTNSAEMCSESKMNAKALREILLYFVREYIDKGNHYIKKLVITNIDKWYVFDARDFVDYFVKNNDFIKEYSAYKEGKFTKSNTAEFYDSIAPKYIDDFLSHEISIAYFTLENLVQTFETKDEKNEKYYYKFFSPENLLDKPFANDSNSLDKNFYNELLYIIGLEEVSEGGKKVIKRRKTRKYGSLLECVIYQLEDKYSGDELYNMSLGLCVVWINRLLFLKLMEASQLNFNNGDDEYRFLTTEKLHDFDMLNELFFKVLAKKPEDRHEQVKKAYKHLPYLNSSLFELSDEEEETHFQIRDIKQMPLEIYPKSVLYNNPKFKEKSLVNIDYLFRFLDAYNFASEGADEIQKESKSLINASVLGLIFEKINGYKDGAFFTPGYITQYIADEVVAKAVVSKFSEKVGRKYETLDEIKEDILDRRIARKDANAIVNSVKVLDPAVGSGHFLVSVLNKLVQIKSYIGALLHPDGEYVAPSEFQVSVENDELSVVDRHGDLYFYKPKGAARKVQEALFHNKKEIIENCLFGVDINPNSVSICRLRLWIELLKHTYYDQDGNLQTLPNIDINIKAGNSLISKYEIKIGRSADRGSAYLKEKINRYKELVEKYKNETNKNVKKEIKAEIVQIKTGCEKTVQCDIYGNETVVNQNELSKNDKLYNHSMEWMIEFPEVLDDEGRFVGFDAVVGNPPYGVKIGDDQIDYCKDRYVSAKTAKEAKGSTDTFALFVELGHTLIKKYGGLGFIVPMSITSSDAMGQLHNLIESDCSLIKIASFSNRPMQVFHAADLRVSTIVLQKDEKPLSKLVTTRVIRRRASQDLKDIIDKLDYVNSLKYKLPCRYPKIGLPIECSILDKLFALGQNVSTYKNNRGKAFYYRTSGGRYWNVVTNYPSESTKEKPYYCRYANLIGLILSSTLFWHYQQVYTNGLDLKMSEIEGFPLPDLSAIAKKKVKELEKLYAEYLEDIEKNASEKTPSDKSGYSISQFKEYKIIMSKPIIDRIDDEVCALYGLNEKETMFIKKYELDVRMGIIEKEDSQE